MNWATKFDLHWRPATYWSEHKRAIGNVTGTARRALLTDALTKHDAAMVEEILVGSLQMAQREALGAVAPWLRSGEDLPAPDKDQVEIARITLASVHGEVTSIRAKRNKGRIWYSVADEYAEEFGYGVRLKRRCSKEPLTLGELIDVINTGWWVDGSRRVGFVRPHWENVLFHCLGNESPDGARAFVHVSSLFYPQLSAAFGAQFEDWAAEHWVTPAMTQRPRQTSDLA